MEKQSSRSRPHHSWHKASMMMMMKFQVSWGWIGHVFTLLVLFTAVFMVLTRCFSQGRPVEEVKVVAPPEMNTMEQLLAVQNVISHVEELVQEGNIILLRLRALLLALFPQATERVAVALLLVALVLAFLPGKFIILLMFLEMFTRNSPLRKPSTERWTRRLKEWWFSIPAAPVILEITKEDKKSSSYTVWSYTFVGRSITWTQMKLWYAQLHVVRVFFERRYGSCQHMPIHADQDHF